MRAGRISGQLQADLAEAPVSRFAMAWAGRFEVHPVPTDSRYNMLAGDGKYDRDMRHYGFNIEGTNVAHKTSERLQDKALVFCRMSMGLLAVSLSFDSDLTRAGAHFRGHCMQRHV